MIPVKLHLNVIDKRNAAASGIDVVKFQAVLTGAIYERVSPVWQ